MFIPEIRAEWDLNIKSVQSIKYTDTYSIVHTHLKSPLFIISERDIVDKKIEFISDGICYNFKTSVDDKFFKPVENVVRCVDYINLYLITEDEEFFYFIGVNQCDAKVNFL
jgi:hypothetical protein